MTTPKTAEWIGLKLQPLDVLFFRDGRPFDAATRVSGGLPNPQTLAGALRTFLLGSVGFRFEEFARVRKSMDVRSALTKCAAPTWITQARFRGPWLALNDGKTVEPLLPLPAVLTPAKDKDKGWSRARPLETKLPGWQDLDGLLPLWRTEESDPKAEARMITLRGLQAFLADGKELKDQPSPDDSTFKIEDLFGFDNRTGIAMDKDTLTSADGGIYGIRLLALKDSLKDGRRLCFYAEIQPGAGAPGNLRFADACVPFGGEGKYVRADQVKPASWPKVDPTAKRSLWYLATPTFLSRSALSKRPLPVGVKAASSGAGIAVSGWDVANNGPRPTRFAVPAGAVYFLEGPGSEEQFISNNQDQQADDLRAEGWGFALQGKW